MMFTMLPPAGDAVALRPQPRAVEAVRARWRPWMPHFYGSGTAALAAALGAAVKLSGRRQTQVILPGYGCPALVSAVLHAGAIPVYADLEPERPWMSLQALERQLGPATVAVVAVNFLGIPERLAAIRRLIAGHPITLVEDSAQAFPARAPGDEADVVVLSFGRGKPVSLLGGGALLVREGALAGALPGVPIRPGRPWQFRAKASLYNLLRRPQLYWLPQMLPLGLGQTRFEPLTAIDAMDEVRLQVLPTAVERFLRRRPEPQHRLLSAAADWAGQGVRDLPGACRLPEDARLSRYPLLAADPASAARLLGSLRAAGIGASGMYGAALPAVPGVPQLHPPVQLSASTDFAERLVTLPVHEGVTPRHLETMTDLLRRHCADLQPARPGFSNREGTT